MAADQLSKLTLLSTIGLGIPTLALVAARRHANRKEIGEDLVNDSVMGGLAGATAGGAMNAVEAPGESSNLRQLARLLLGGAGGAGVGALASVAKNHDKFSSLKENQMTFAEVITKMASDYKATNSPGVKTASSDEEIKAFAVGVAKFAADADLDEKEFDLFHGACIKAFQSIK